MKCDKRGKDLIVLIEGDGLNIARETFCYEHGYQNSCYMCGQLEGRAVWNTEICRRHAGMNLIEMCRRINDMSENSVWKKREKLNDNIK